MSNIKNILGLSELSLAAYADLQSGKETSDSKQIRSLESAGMNSTQAANFSDKYTDIVIQHTDPSGFSATVFLSSDNKLSLAIRGTDQIIGADLDDDANIITSGLAIQQALVMYNWWLRVNAPAGQEVPQYDMAFYTVSHTPPEGAQFWYEVSPQSVYLQPSTTAVATGEVNDAMAITGESRLDITGHSLGGHLSMVFAGLFPEITDTVTVFNAPGLITDTQRNRNFFNILGGVVPDGSHVTNVIADEAGIGDAPWSAIAGLHNRPGKAVDIAIENQWLSEEPNPAAALNHSQQLLTDALAVYQIIAGLDNRVTDTQFKQLLTAADGGTAGSYEAMIDAVQQWLDIDSTDLSVGNTNREALYSAIQSIQENSHYKNIAGSSSLQFLRDTDIVSVAAQADDEGRAYRFALVNALPFTITGYTNTAAASSDYDLTNFSEHYLQDRAQYLSYLLERNSSDAVLDALPSPGSEPFDTYRDLESDDGFTVLPDRDDQGNTVIAGPDVTLLDSAHALTVFGSEEAERLIGNQHNDSFYGGAGNDTLTGGEGDDYLEGGAGADTYRFHYGDGRDVVVDRSEGNQLLIEHKEGQGQQSVTVLSLLEGTDNLYAEFDGDGQRLQDTTYLVVDAPTADNPSQQHLIINIDGGRGGVVTIEGWSASAFSMTLDQQAPMVAPASPNTTSTLQVVLDDGADNPVNDGLLPPEDPNDPEEEPLIDIARVRFEENATDNNHLVGSRYIDSLAGFRGDDVIDLKDGRLPVGFEDSVFADQGFGGLGNDQLVGGDHQQVLWGNTSTRFAFVPSGDRTSSVVLSGDQVSYQVYRASGFSDDDHLSGGKGEDVISGDEGQDYAVGGADNDTVAGGAGNDSLYGDAGDDVLLGDAALDYLSYYRFYSAEQVEEAGLRGISSLVMVNIAQADGVHGYDDVIDGGLGDDTVIGGLGHDTVIGAEGDDYIQGDHRVSDSHSEADFRLTDHFGTNRLYGDALTHEGYGHDILLGGAGNDTIYGQGGDDMVEGGEHHDRLYGDDSEIDDAFHGNDLLSGGEGDDQLVGGGAHDHLFGGEGNDSLLGDNTGIDEVAGEYHGEDVLDGGLGNDQLIGGGGADHLTGGHGDDVLLGDNANFADVGGEYHGDDFLLGGEGDDQLIGGGGADRLTGGHGDDVLLGDNADSADIGSEYHGDDVLLGGEGNDQLVGGGGADHLTGGHGDDVLLGDNADSADVGSEYHGDDVLVGGEGDDQLIGAGGADVLQGGMGHDLLMGGEGDDALQGGKGADGMEGGKGNDRYIFTIGDSLPNEQGEYDSVEDTEGKSTLILQGASIGDIRIDSNGQRVGERVIAYSEQDKIVMSNATFATIDQFIIGGSAYFYADLLARDVSNSFLGGDGADEMDGGAGDDQLIGGGGDDHLIGGTGNDALFGDDGAQFGVLRGNDRLEGGAGDDQLIGGAGDDVLLGGTGVDYLDGGEGNDTYSFIRGDSLVANNRIDFMVDHIGNNTLQFVSASVNDLRIITHSGGQVSMSYSSEDTIALDKAVFASIETIVVGDTHYTRSELLNMLYAIDHIGLPVNQSVVGSEIADILLGGQANDQLQGQQGDDHLRGGEGADTYFYALGDGSDWIDAKDSAASGQDILQFAEGILPEEVRLERVKDDLIIGFVGLSDTIKVSQFYVDSVDKEYGLDIAFSQGSYWNKEFIVAQTLATATEGDDVLIGNSADNVIAGLGGNDTIRGAGGEDHLFGGSGDDRLLGGEGRDTLAGGDHADDLLGEAGHDSLEGGLGDDTLAGGTGNDILQGGAGQDSLVGDAGNDILEGGTGQDSLEGGAGNDILKGGAGQDSLEGGAGNDALEGGTGQDSLEGGAGNDTLEGGADNDILKGDDGHDSLRGGDGHDVLDGALGDDYLLGAIGDDTLRGGKGTDSLYGSNDNDVLEGGQGNDRLVGGQGTDRYLFNLGDGVDYIDDGGDFSEKDRIVFGEGISVDDVRLFEKSNDLLILFDHPDDMIYVERSANIAIEFADGSLWNAAEIQARSAFVAPIDRGVNVGDQEFANVYATRLGTAFQYTLFGDDRNNVIFGSTVYENNMDGGVGADVMFGSSASDVYYVDNAHDVVSEYFARSDKGTDIIISSVDYSAPEAIDHLYLDNPEITYGGGNALDNVMYSNAEGVTLEGGQGDDIYYAYSSANIIEQEGEGIDWWWSASEGVTSLQDTPFIENLKATESGATLIGNDNNNALYGKGYDLSHLYSYTDIRHYSDYRYYNALFEVTPWSYGSYRDGSNTFEGGKGDDYLYGGSHADTYRYSLGDGNDAISDQRRHIIYNGRRLYPNGGHGEDRLVFDQSVHIDDVSFVREGDDLLVMVGDGTIRIESGFEGAGVIERFEFSIPTATTLTMDDVRTRVEGNVVANDDHASTQENSAIVFTFAELLGNDSHDNPADAMLISAVSNGTNGTVSIDTTLQAITFIPTADYVGEASFDYTLVNGRGASDVATVSIDVEEVPTPPGLLREWWSDIGPGDQLSVLRDHPTFIADTPTGSEYLTEFVGPTNWGEYYGTRISGVFVAPTSGDYTFWVSGDNDVELWLSHDITRANKALIAGVRGYTRPQEWDKYSQQQSAPIHLTAGESYYIEALHKESGGGDHLAVGWQLPGSSEIEVIRGDYFGEPDISPTNTLPTVDAPLADQEVDEDATLRIELPANTFSDVDGDALTLTASLSNGDPLPNWLVFTPSTQTFSGIPLNADVGSLEIIVTAEDGRGGSVSDTFVLTIHNTNDNPTANGDSGQTQENNALTLTFAELLANDSDMDVDDVLSITAVENATNGSVTIDHDSQTIRFIPAEGYFGEASFDYTLDDGQGGGDVATVMLTVTPDPVITGTVGNDLLTGTTFDNHLYGLVGDDELIGGIGNDTLEGGLGHDTYFYSAGDGSDVIVGENTHQEDVLVFDETITPDQVVVSTSSDRRDLLLQVTTNGHQETMTIKDYFVSSYYISNNIHTIEFADGTVWDQQSINQQLFNATEGDDEITGTHDKDTLYASAGNDTIDAGQGNDDVFAGSGDDIIEGGRGHDFLLGGKGNDTYIFAGDFGQDRINNIDYAGTINKIVFQDLTDIHQLWFTRNDNDVVISVIGTDNQVTIRHWYDGPHQSMDEIHLGGQVLTTANVESLLDVMATRSPTVPSGVTNISASVQSAVTAAWVSSNNDNLAQVLSGDEQANTLQGYGGDDVMDGQGGHDHLYGGDDMDKLYGGSGHDQLYGESGADDLLGGVGDDLLVGGEGDDYLYGDSGNDTYFFSGHFGQDRINNNEGWGTYHDRVEFDDVDIETNDLWFSQQGNDLQVDVLGSDERVTVRNWYGATNQVDEFRVGSSVLLANQVNNLVQILATADSADVDNDGVLDITRLDDLSAVDKQLAQEAMNTAWS
ncbi:hypothetical protein AB835_11285 [Candidatus Endobugula sertula]|uniref:PA14 domain-containing protein n=1 Tax=Candidatus Endobugula sertula TaxID=62101 RepID=A0A1D2QN21_9GAMM|nr:hypothetical protein AB835_11285 [Candidatus Endobugula sertula]